MKSFGFCALGMLLPTLLPALTLDVPRLPAPTFADREVSADIAATGNLDRNLRVFTLSLTFDATASNNVQVAFGADGARMDGALAAEETDFIVGWDSGEWFLRPRGLRERYACAAAGGQSAQRRTFGMTVRVSEQGAPESVAFEDDAGEIVFEGLTVTPMPSWLTPAAWTLLRVTARGADASAEDSQVRFLPDGATIIVR
ncbi:MAG: hypothetical protein PHR35_18585 [Kiritimatiellae bacterium]|nr:hypothetical protein [Kiritimatiellia bacterium]